MKPILGKTISGTNRRGGTFERSAGISQEEARILKIDAVSGLHIAGDTAEDHVAISESQTSRAMKRIS
jgi:hypothetical protein